MLAPLAQMQLLLCHDTRKRSHKLRDRDRTSLLASCIADPWFAQVKAEPGTANSESSCQYPSDCTGDRHLTAKELPSDLGSEEPGPHLQNKWNWVCPFLSVEAKQEVLDLIQKIPSCPDLSLKFLYLLLSSCALVFHSPFRRGAVRWADEVWRLCF